MSSTKFAVAVLILLTLPGYCQDISQWGNLKKGPFQVGYRTHLAYDLSRNYIDKGKPIQIYVWYPTEDSISPNMIFGDYFEDAIKDFGSDTVYTKLVLHDIPKEFKNGALNPSFGKQISEGEFKGISGTRIPSVKEAIPANGRFPLVLHTHVSGVLHQSIMLEYLASHGFVVLSFSMYNTSPVHYGRGEDGSNALQSYAEDLGFVLAQAKQFDFVDPTKVAMIGMLAQIGLTFQFKEALLDALVCLDCPGDWSEAQQRELPFYDTKRIRIPILAMSNSEQPDQNMTFLDSLPYSERYKVRLNDFPHSDFYPFPKIADPGSSKSHRNYEFITELTQLFLSMTLYPENDARKEFVALAKQNPMAHLISSIQEMNAEDPVYTENEFLTYLRFGQLDKIQGEYRGKEYVTSINKSNLFSVILFLCRDKKPHAKDAISIYENAYPDDPRTKMLYDLLED